MTPQSILQPRRIQSFDRTVLQAVFDCIVHFVGHSHEIVYITRLQLRDRYKFQFVPQTKEQGAP